MNVLLFVGGVTLTLVSAVIYTTPSGEWFHAVAMFVGIGCALPLAITGR